MNRIGQPVLYHTNPDHKMMSNTRSVHKYESDRAHWSDVKKGILKSIIMKLHIKLMSEKYLLKKKRSVEKYNVDLERKNAVKRRSVEKYSTNLEHKKCWETCNVCKSEKKCKRKFISNAIKEFKVDSSRTPTAVCVICVCVCFPDEDEVFNKFDCTQPKEILMFLDYYTDRILCSGHIDGSHYICHTCDSYINRGRLPPRASVNNMQLCEPDLVFDSLNKVEQQLISLFLPFEKLITLPRSNQGSTKRPDVCVPSNLTLWQVFSQYQQERLENYTSVFEKTIRTIWISGSWYRKTRSCFE